ncbi:MAG TPA: hypothetical protein VK989_09810 [Polyangia bacterium]|nr:hypothetical protein [Polyangia bacterium]
MVVPAPRVSNGGAARERSARDAATRLENFFSGADSITYGLVAETITKPHGNLYDPRRRGRLALRETEFAFCKSRGLS